MRGRDRAGDLSRRPCHRIVGLIVGVLGAERRHLFVIAIRPVAVPREAGTDQGGHLVRRAEGRPITEAVEGGRGAFACRRRTAGRRRTIHRRGVAPAHRFGGQGRAWVRTLRRRRRRA